MGAIQVQGFLTLVVWLGIFGNITFNDFISFFQVTCMTRQEKRGIVSQDPIPVVRIPSTTITIIITTTTIITSIKLMMRRTT